MKKKILYLTLSCIVTVIALACIQGYFIYNTYKLREKEAHTAITQKLLKIETDGMLDSLNHAWMKKTGRFFRQYMAGKATKADYVKLIDKTADTLSPIMREYIHKEKLVDKYDVSYVNYVRSVVLMYNDKPNDTLFVGKQKLFGNNSEHTPETKASESSWRSSTADLSTNPDKSKDVNFEVVTERAYGIANWEREVMLKMSGLLIFSVLLLAFVVALFYIAIKSLIRQRRIADIKTDFINNITHEFHTPLAALDIAVKTLQRKEAELSPENYANTLAIINRQNERMQKLFAQVKEASLQPDAEITGQFLTFVDVVEVVNDFRLSHPDIIIHCIAEEDESPTLKMDKFHLNTVLHNLLDNAVKYGATEVEVMLSGSGNSSVIRVKDNGPGIPDKEQKAVFEKFYRVQKGDIHTTKGLGLGLFYVKNLVTTYKGAITLKSHDGQGAEFIITLPA